MLHAIVMDAKFWRFLLRLDEDLAAQAQRLGCSHCGAPLHSARYPRKPRGAARRILGPDYAWRLSFCCSREGCRLRTTPASVRFLGRRVYLGALVVLVTALSQGLSARRRAQVFEPMDVSERTVKRWRRWWREVFPTTRLWQARRAWFIPPVPSAGLPHSLLERFVLSGERARLVRVLRFLQPLSTRSSRSMRGSTDPQKMRSSVI